MSKTDSNAPRSVLGAGRSLKRKTFAQRVKRINGRPGTDSSEKKNSHESADREGLSAS